MYTCRCEASPGVQSPFEQLGYQHQTHHWGRRGLVLLDTKMVRKEGHSLKVTIYYKLTHTGKYFNFSANHWLDHKMSMVRTLPYRATRDNYGGGEDSRDWTFDKSYQELWLTRLGGQKRGNPSTGTNRPDKHSNGREEKEQVIADTTTLYQGPVRRGENLQGIWLWLLFQTQEHFPWQLLCTLKEPAKKEEQSSIVYQINFFS